MPKIEIITNIKAEPEIVFDLARSIDLHKISTRQTKEEAIDGVTSGLIGLNQFVTWRAKHFGFYHVLTAKITAYERPNYFRDEMLDGIFKHFKHDHFFKKTVDGTEMTDVFDYESPLGILGKLADYVFLKNYMKRFLEKRSKIIKEFAESDDRKQILAA